MIIICTKCSTHFNLDDSLVKEGGTKCRCAVCKHILTAYPLSPEPEPWEAEPEMTEPEASEHDTPVAEAPEPEADETEVLYDDNSDAEMEESSEFDFESLEGDDDLFDDNSEIKMENIETPSTDSDIEPENPYLDTTDDDLEAVDNDLDLDLDEPDLEVDASGLDLEEPDLDFDESDLDFEEPDLEVDASGLELDDDFSLEEDAFDEKEDLLSKGPETQETPVKPDEDDQDLEAADDELIALDESPVLEEPETLEEQSLLGDEQNELENAASVDVPETEKTAADETLSLLDGDGPIEKDPSPKKDPEETVPVEKDTKEIEPPPKKERKVIVKPQPAVTAKPPKEKKKSSSRILVIILLLIFLLAIGGYIASVMTGYKIPVIDQFLKKPAPEISQVKPIPNQKSVNGRFVTNSTAGTLFVITGRVENPSNIAYSHIEIRGALITKDKEEAKVKNAFCGNIITEEMLKDGNISDINTLLTLKEGAHKINVNVAPGASVPFMIVFSDLPEKLHNFTVKVAGFDKSIN